MPSIACTFQASEYAHGIFRWRVSLKELETFLGSKGFALKTVLHEDEGLGTAIFWRKEK